MTDGEVDPTKVMKHFEKNKVDVFDERRADSGPPQLQGFISAQ